MILSRTQLIINSIRWQRSLPAIVLGVFFKAADDWAATERDYKGAAAAANAASAAAEAAAEARARRVHAAFRDAFGGRVPDDFPLLRFSRNLTAADGERLGGFEEVQA